MHLGKSNNTGRQVIDATPFFKSNRGCTLHGHSLKSEPKVAILDLKIVLDLSHQMRRGAIIVGTS